METIKLLFIISILTVGCSPNSQNKVGYVEYLKNEDNGLKQSQEIGAIEFNLQYESINLKVLKKNKTKKNSQEQYLKELKLMDGTQYFIFRMSISNNNKELLKYGVKNAEEYSERVQYFSSRIQHDFYLLEGEDSLLCKLFHFERDYGISNKATFLLGFDSKDKLIKTNDTYKEETMNNKIMVYDDKVFGLGPIKYVIKQKDINNIPELILE